MASQPPFTSPSAPCAAPFYRQMMARSMGATGQFVVALAIDSNERDLSGLLDVMEAMGTNDRKPSNKEVETWLAGYQRVSMETGTRGFAVAKRLMKDQTDATGVNATVLEALAAVVWPIEPPSGSAAAHCQEVLLDGAQRRHIDRLGRFLKAMQGPIKVTRTRTKGDAGLFDAFVSHCLTGVRDREVLRKLVDLGPDWRSEVIHGGRRVQRHFESASVNLAHIPALELNPAAIDVLRERSLVGDAPDLITPMVHSFSAEIANDRTIEPKQVIRALRREVRDGTDQKPTSLANTLDRLLQVAPAQSQTLIVKAWLGEAFRVKQQNEVQDIDPVLDRLWGWAGQDFISRLKNAQDQENEEIANPRLRGLIGANTQQTQDLICQAAASSFLPLLRDLPEQVQRLVYSAQAWPDPQGGPTDLVYQACMGVCGKTSVRLEAFHETLQFLVAHGASLSEPSARYEGGEGVLHRMARRGGPLALPAMLAVVEMGGNPQEKNERGWTPRSHLNAVQKPLWDSMLRSLEAKRVAQAALLEITSDLCHAASP